MFTFKKVANLNVYNFLEATWGSVPFIEFEGKQLGQSLAMTRFFARRHNLVPSNEFHVALCDEYVEAIRDFFTSKETT